MLAVIRRVEGRNAPGVEPGHHRGEVAARGRAIRGSIYSEMTGCPRSPGCAGRVNSTRRMKGIFRAIFFAQVLDCRAMRLFKRVKRLILVFVRPGEDHPDHHLSGLDDGLVAVLQHLDLLHGPVAELPAQLFFGPALEALLLFLVHDQLHGCWSN